MLEHARPSRVNSPRVNPQFNIKHYQFTSLYTENNDLTKDYYSWGNTNMWPKLYCVLEGESCPIPTWYVDRSASFVVIKLHTDNSVNDTGRWADIVCSTNDYGSIELRANNDSTINGIRARCLSNVNLGFYWSKFTAKYWNYWILAYLADPLIVPKNYCLDFMFKGIYSQWF